MKKEKESIAKIRREVTKPKKFNVLSYKSLENEFCRDCPYAGSCCGSSMTDCVHV